MWASGSSREQYRREQYHHYAYQYSIAVSTGWFFSCGGVVVGFCFFFWLFGFGSVAGSCASGPSNGGRRSALWNTSASYATFASW